HVRLGSPMRLTPISCWPPAPTCAIRAGTQAMESTPRPPEASGRRPFLALPACVRATTAGQFGRACPAIGGVWPLAINTEVNSSRLTFKEEKEVNIEFHTRRDREKSCRATSPSKQKLRGNAENMSHPGGRNS